MRHLQSFISDKTVIIVGSGLSVAEGIPGMPSLEAAINDAVSAISFEQIRSEWEKIASKIPSLSLEGALFDHPPSDELEILIQSTVGSFINKHEKIILRDLLFGKKVLRFSRFLKRFSASTKPLRVITTNYDRLVEIGANLANLSVDNGFSREIVGSMKSRSQKYDHMKGVKLEAGKRITYLFEDRILVAKPHGSLDWYSVNGNQFRTTIEIDQTPLIITPGTKKYRAGYDQPFDRQRELANQWIDSAQKLMFIGYGFNDDHLETHIRQRASAGVPILSLARSITPKAEDLANQTEAMTVLYLAEKDGGEGTQWKMGSDLVFLPGKCWWDLGSFVTEVLEP